MYYYARESIQFLISTISLPTVLMFNKVLLGRLETIITETTARYAAAVSLVV